MTHGPGHGDRVRGVTVDADGLDVDRDVGTVDGPDELLGDHAGDPGGDLRRVVQDRPVDRARHQCPVRGVGAVGESFADRAEPPSLGRCQQPRARQAENGERRVDRGDGVRHGGSVLLVVHRGVVQSAVRLHVADSRACGCSDSLQRPDLVDDVVGQLLPGRIDEAPPEAGQVSVRHLGPEPYVVRSRPADGAGQRAGVTRMESARHVGARDEAEHRLVVAEHPSPERLPDVAVQIHRDPPAHSADRPVRDL
jgi:hypothetical protein